MIVLQRYSSGLKRCLMLNFCILAGGWQMLTQAQDIIVTPSNVICKGHAYPKLEVMITGAYYQWQKHNGVDFENITGLYEVNAKEYYTDEEGKYRCVVDGVASTSVTITVNNVPSGSIDLPAVCEGGVVKAKAVDVKDNGSTILTYEWRLNGTVVGTNSELTHDALLIISGNTLTLSITNGCGTSVVSEVIDVKPTPSPPVSLNIEYCQYAVSNPLSVGDGIDALWYDLAMGGVGSPQAPGPPSTNVSGTHTWWVSQLVSYPVEGIVCESNRAEVSVYIRALSDSPDIADRTPELCTSDPAPNLQLQISGNKIQWYNAKKESLSAAPQINTSTAGVQTYYVTQTQLGFCESLKEGGMIEVKIKDRSKVADIILSEYHPNLCPNSSTRITVTSTSQVKNPEFKWYADQNKTILITQDVDDTTPRASTLTTPVLMSDTYYYVSMKEEGKCESDNPKTVAIFVRDNELPKIKAPKSIEVPTDPGQCFASAVDIGWPIVSDNCTAQSNLVVLIYYEEVPFPVPPRYYPLGDSTLMWWVRDDAGKMDKDLQNISVRDKEKPKPNSYGGCPAEIIKEIDGNETSAVVFYDLDYTDNCSVVFYERDLDSPPSGSVFELGRTRIRHFIRDKAGNVDTCDFYVKVRYPERPLEISSLRVLNNPICRGQEAVITPIVSGGYGRLTYSWKPRTWTEPVMRDYPPSTTTYELTVSDGISEPQTKSVDITVLQTEQVKLELIGRPMEEIFEGDEVLVMATKGFDTYKLMLNGQTIQEAGVYSDVTFQAELGTYVVRVFATDGNYCVTQDQMIIEVDSRKLPNVFTPNFDGINDVFLDFLETPNEPGNFQIEIFTRTGVPLYKGNKGWNGIYKGKMMSQGTYLYVVRRKMNSGEYRIFKGNVTLKL